MLFLSAVHSSQLNSRCGRKSFKGIPSYSENGETMLCFRFVSLIGTACKYLIPDRIVRYFVCFCKKYTVSVIYFFTVCSKCVHVPKTAHLNFLMYASKSLFFICNFVHHFLMYKLAAKSCRLDNLH